MGILLKFCTMFAFVSKLFQMLRAVPEPFPSFRLRPDNSFSRRVHGNKNDFLCQARCETIRRAFQCEMKYPVITCQAGKEYCIGVAAETAVCGICG